MVSLPGESEIQQMLADPAQRQSAFSTLVRTYSRPLYWKIRGIVVTHENADDVLQNTFLKAWRNLDDFRGGSKLSTWLYRIAVNESLDYLRKEKTRAQQADSPLSSAHRTSTGPSQGGRSHVARSTTGRLHPPLFRQYEIQGNESGLADQRRCTQGFLPFRSGESDQLSTGSSVGPFVQDDVDDDGCTDEWCDGIDGHVAPVGGEGYDAATENDAGHERSLVIVAK